MKNYTLCFLLVGACAIIALHSCKKENSNTDTLNAQQEQAAATLFAKSETDLEFSFNDVFDNVMGVSPDVGLGGTGVFGFAPQSGPVLQKPDSLPSCATVTITHLNASNTFPLKAVIDFGTTGCLCADGHVRKGKIITTYTGHLYITGNSATTVFDGYKIDSLAIQGTHVITNTGNTTNTACRQFSVTITGAKITKPNGNYLQWEGNRVYTQVEGCVTSTPQAQAIVFNITGAAHGQALQGNTLYIWHSEITDALRKRFNCHWIVKGILKVTRETLPTNSPWVATLDYGSGACDNQAVLTINGASQQITLH